MTSLAPEPDKAVPNYGASRAWNAELRLAYVEKDSKTILDQMRFKGPLRVQRPFYPEDGLCHTYLLHPPGGMVSGDHIDINIVARDRARTFITTPSAGKVYGADSANVIQRQDICLEVKEGASLEFLPQENILFDGANAILHTDIDIDEHSQLICWDIVSFGRPHGNLPFKSGSLRQQISIRIAGRLALHEGFKTDEELKVLGSPAGLMGHLHMGSMFVCVPRKDELYDQWVDLIRPLLPLTDTLKASATHRNGIVIVRALGDDIETVRNLFIDVWQTIRKETLNVEPVMPRIWLT